MANQHCHKWFEDDAPEALPKEKSNIRYNGSIDDSFPYPVNARPASSTLRLCQRYFCIVPLAPPPSVHENGNEEEELLPEPYGTFSNPHRRFLDALVDSMMPKMMPLGNLAHQCAFTDMSHEKLVETMQQFRTKFDRVAEMGYKNECRRMEKEWDWTSIELEFSRNHRILQDWGVVKGDIPPWQEGRSGTKKEMLHQEFSQKKTKKKMMRSDNDECVHVVLHGPKSVLNSTAGLSSQNKEADSDAGPDADSDADGNATGEMELFRIRDNLQGISKNVPVLVWFHGGGMQLGTRWDARALQYVRELLARQKRREMEYGNGADKDIPTMLYVSVEYGLAPENPFPSGIIDGLVATEKIVEAFKDVAEIHIAGESAGGNIAATVAMEVYRKYPGRIKSAHILVPMLDPCADSLSYHMNSTSARLVTVNWLQWAWRAYLDLSESLAARTITKVCPENGSSGTMQMKSCNRELVEATIVSSCKNTNDLAWLRLICPHVDLPAGLDKPNAPQVMVTTNLADPLRDDGVEMVSYFKARDANKIVLMESTGSHAMGLMFDKDTNQLVMNTWIKFLFG